MIWQTSRFKIDLSTARVMGIVNATPDSFSDGGRYFTPGGPTALILDHCTQLVKDGADMLDIGGESTRPGAAPLSYDDERERVLPVLRHAMTLGVPVSVDTYKPDLMRAVLDLGADIINDVWALRQPGAEAVIAAHPSCGICLMHMHGEPQTMQRSPMEGDVVPQVSEFLNRRAQTLLGLGIDAGRIVLDPGIGFGKTVEQNFSLLARQQAICGLGFPLLAGWSRKSSLAAVSSASLASVAQLNVVERMVPSIAAAVLAADRGARILRVHDVRETVQALKVWRAAAH